MSPDEATNAAGRMPAPTCKNYWVASGRRRMCPPNSGGGQDRPSPSGQSACASCTPDRPQLPPLDWNSYNNEPPTSGIDGAASTASTSNAPGVPDEAYSNGSLIDNITSNYIHYAWDYQDSTARNRWSTVALGRFFRSRDIAWYSSFGPGHFCNYDIRLVHTIYDINSQHPSYGFFLFDPTSPDGENYEGTWQYLDANGDPAPPAQDPSDHPGAAIEFKATNGSRFLFEIIDFANYQHIDARLTRIEDNNGYGVSLAYKAFTSTEITASPERLWQIDTATDDEGRTMTFTYGSTQVGGRWAVSQVELPNGETVSYSYSSGRLSSISHPDGTTSTFTHSVQYDNNSYPRYDKLVISDPAAAPTSRHKAVYLSMQNYYYSAYTSQNNLYNTATQHAQIVVNGDDEVSYAALGSYIYQGRGKMLRYFSAGKIAALADGWYLTPTYGPPLGGGDDVFQGFAVSGTPDAATEYVYTSGTYGSGKPYETISNDGVTKVYTYSGEWVSQITYEDDTKENFAYNARKQVTRYKDRIGNVTKYTYDSNGNMLTKEVGIVEQANASWLEGYSDGYEEGFTEGQNMQYDPATSFPNPDYEAGYTPGYDAGYYDGEGSQPHGESFNPNPPTSDVNSDEHAVHEWEYFASGTNKGKLAKYIDPNGSETDYTYDSNHRLETITYPPDVPMGTRADRNFTYDAAGRLSTITEPGGWGTSYEYDDRSRLVKIEHADDSTERLIYGTGSDANLLVKYKDRAGMVTKYEYDGSGRLTKTISAYATMDLSDSETLITDAAVKSEEIYTYHEGTNLVATHTTAGDLTEYEYDYRHRLVSMTRHPDTSTDLESTSTYVDNKLFYTTDPYGRKTYFAYDTSDARPIRKIRCTVPSVSYANFAAALAATRAAENAENPTSLITDYIYDAAGQPLKVIDPRGVEHHKEYDSRGRITADIRAAQWLNEDPTGCAARTEYDYDDASNVVAIRHPRYFDNTDTNGYQKCVTTMTYSGRNLLASRTEADGATEEATESFTYNLDGKQLTRIDFNGKTWISTYGSCCGRLQATADPLGHGKIVNHDTMGRVTHEVWVSDVSSHSSAWDSPIDAKTLSEVTTRYDARGRLSARTVWLTPLGTVDPKDVPIYSGAPVHDSANPPSGTYIGLTTTYTYDHDLDDGTGLDSTFSSHLTGLNLDDDCDGSAVLVTAPDSNRTFTIRDGDGRNIRSVRLDSSGNAIARSTQDYDAVVTVSGYGDVVETTSTNLANHSNKRRTDGAGRTITTVDGDSKATTFKYNANGNRLEFRDPNSIGQDRTYDALGRETSFVDTATHGGSKQFDHSGNLIVEIDAKSNPMLIAYDARNRKVSSTDRISAETTWTYDGNGKELSITDAENQTTSYGYDDAGHRTTTTWPDHVAMTNPGDANHGITEVTYDAAGRPVRTTDQKGDTITHVYDLAGRRTHRVYRTLANSPAGTIADQDTFTYNASTQPLTAVKGRYSNTVTFTYADGRKASESLTIGGQTYTVLTDYDDDGLVSQLTYPDSTTVGRTYNARGLLSTISYGGGTIDSRTYDDGGRLTSESLGNGLTVTTSYETGENLIASIANTAVGTYGYDWDANHNKTAETITGAMANYGFTVPSGGYDDEDRLVEWNRHDSNLDQEWSLSDVGDWDTFTENGTPVNRTHGNAHELTAVGSNSLTYDSKGNLTQDDTGRTYNWDMDNMLTSTTASSTTVSYAYDALGRRASRTAGGTITVFVASGHIVFAEYTSGTAASSPLRKYINATYVDEPVLLVDRTAAGGTGAGTDERLYYHHNQQYSISALTDNSGGVVERYSYTSYGQPTIWNAAVSSTRTSSDYGNPYLYTARAYEPDTGLHYFRARYLQSRLGRFLNRDPLKYPNGPHSYSAYFSITGVDPSGRFACVGTGAGFAFVCGAKVTWYFCFDKCGNSATIEVGAAKVGIGVNIPGTPALINRGNDCLTKDALENLDLTGPKLPTVIWTPTGIPIVLPNIDFETNIRILDTDFENGCDCTDPPPPPPKDPPADDPIFPACDKRCCDCGLDPYDPDRGYRECFARCALGDYDVFDEFGCN